MSCFEYKLKSCVRFWEGEKENPLIAEARGKILVFSVSLWSRGWDFGYSQEV